MSKLPLNYERLHPKCRPPRSAQVICAYDLEMWGDTDDGEPHHAFLCADPKDKTHAIAYVADCSCSDRGCPRMKIMIASRAFFDSLTIVVVVPKQKARKK
jgi:hypothetical protein